MLCVLCGGADSTLLTLYNDDNQGSHFHTTQYTQSRLQHEFNNEQSHIVGPTAKKLHKTITNILTIQMTILKHSAHDI